MSDVTLESIVESRQRPPFRLAGAELLEVVSRDPRDPLHRGRLRALLARLQRESYGRPTPQRPLLEWMLAQAEGSSSYDHPMRGPVNGRPRALTVGDVEFLNSLRGVPPAHVSAQDAALLHELDAVAESSTERRLVAQVVDPVRRHHDRCAEEAQLRATVARQPWHSPENRLLALQWVEDAMVAEARARLNAQLQPGTRDDVRERIEHEAIEGARGLARAGMEEAWVTGDPRLAVEREAARARLSELARGADPRSSKPAGPSRALEDGRERARKERGACSSADALRHEFGGAGDVVLVPKQVATPVDEPETAV